MTIPFWVQGGRTVNLLDIQPADVTAEALAESLAKLNRFSGRSPEPWPVATHSVLVERLCPPELGPWAILHDAHETILGDMTTPAVELISHAGRIPNLAVVIASVKGRIDRVIGGAWGVPVRSVSQELRRADRIALQAEAILFLGAEPVLFDAHDDDDIDRAMSILIELQAAREWRAARDLWLSRVEHYALLGRMTPPKAQNQPQTENN